jgi:hypothetical protein
MPAMYAAKVGVDPFTDVLMTQRLSTGQAVGSVSANSAPLR